MSKWASTQQLKLIMLMEDLTGAERLWDRKLPPWKVRLSPGVAKKRIAQLTRVAVFMRIPEYKYKPFPVRRYRMDD